jgi:hypothetical protein
MSTTTMAWHRSSFCATGSCVEVTKVADGIVGVRDSKNLDQPPLLFDRADWHHFLDMITASSGKISAL